MELSDRIGRRMKLRDLQVLMTVVQLGSMGKAAERLNTSQPAISRSIAGLEHAFGVRLLERQSQGVEPTAYGRALLDCGIAVFDDLRRGLKTIEFLADPAGGEIRIGTNHFLATSFVAAVIDKLSRRYPRMVFHVVADRTETLHRELQERNVDLLVTWKLGPFADERLRFETLFDDSYVVVAGAQNPWTQRRSISLAQLVDESWALPPPESVLGTMAMAAFRASGCDYPRATVITIPAQMMISLLPSGRFLAICSTSLLRFPRKHSEIKVLPVALPIPGVPIGIASLKNRAFGPVGGLFVEQARELARPLKQNTEKRSGHAKVA